MYLNNISRFILDYGFVPKYTRAELKELPDLLSSDESLEAIMEGTVKLIHNTHVNTAALIVATDQRLIITSKSYQGGKLQKTISIPSITAYKLKTSRTTGTIEFNAFDTSTCFWSYNIEECKRFYSLTQELLVKPVEKHTRLSTISNYIKPQSV